MDYSNYRLYDFLNDDSFVRWVLFGENSSVWSKAGEEFPDIRPDLVRASEIIWQLYREEHRDALVLDEEKILSNILQKIESPGPALHEPPGVRRKTARLWWPAAAGICLLLGGLYYFRDQHRAGDHYQDQIVIAAREEKLAETINLSDTLMRIVLEDGTAVVLKKGSKISYPVTFGGSSRKTILSGEAFFEVTPMPDRPFYVFANGLVTKVLGTSFDVKALEGDSEVRVNVHTGHVSVYNQKYGREPGSPDPGGLILVPNQQAVFDRKRESLMKKLSDDISLLVPPEIAYRKQFEEVPVSKVLRELERTYGINILYNKEVLSTCIISTTLGAESLFDKLDVICETIGASYTEIEAQIVIESAGCK